MPEISTVLTNDAIRRQVLLEGVKEDVHEKFLPFLRKLDREIRLRLSEEGETIASKRRLRVLLSDINRIQDDVYSGYLGQLELDLNDIALTEADLEIEALDNAVEAFEAIKPSEDQIIIAYRNNPLSIRGKSQGLTLEPFLKNYSASQRQLISGMISQGFAEGRTISQITRDIRGTSGQKFKDGQLAGINRKNRAMVRTAIQNAGEQARDRVWQSNKDLIKGVEWVSTLDGRTTPQCRALDGKRFPLDSGPRPPIHYSCRSTVTPLLSERYDFLDKGAKRPSVGADGAKQVGVDTTYYSWLKTQPASFQDDVIGPTRAKLLRDGGLTSDEFAKLNLNKNFKPRTIAEMKAQARDAFKKANLA